MLDSNVHAITATATDVGGAGVASVLFEVSDGGPFTPIGSADTTAPYSVGWDTSSVSDGPKTLRATATDNVGNTTVVTRSVAVDKVVGPPEHVDRSEPDRPGQRHDAAVHVHGHRDAGHLRVQRRRRRLELLRHAVHGLPRPGGRLAHLRGACDRRGRQHRPDPGELHLGRRRDAPDRLADRARRGRRGLGQRRHRQLELGRRALGRRGRALRGLARRSRHLVDDRASPTPRRRTRSPGTRRPSATATTTSASRPATRPATPSSRLCARSSSTTPPRASRSTSTRRSTSPRPIRRRSARPPPTRARASTTSSSSSATAPARPAASPTGRR